MVKEILHKKLSRAVDREKECTSETSKLSWKKRQENPTGAIKDHNWAIWCPPGNSGLPQETVVLSGSREGQESLREQIVIHDQHSSLEVILPQASCWEGRKWLLDSTGNVLIHSFDRFFFAIRAPAQDWSGYFQQWAVTPLSTPRKNLNREHSFPGWVTPHIDFRFNHCHIFF